MLGSNLGDRKMFLEKAQEEMIASIGNLIKVSNVYETEPWKMDSKLPFLNMAVKVKTKLTPIAVLNELLKIEQMLGRIREEKWVSRTIDLDIALYDNIVLNEADLIIPHPRLHLRNFVLAPLAEIAGGEIHPILNLSKKRSCFTDSLKTLPNSNCTQKFG